MSERTSETTQPALPLLAESAGQPKPRPTMAPRTCAVCPSTHAFFGFGPAKTVKGHADAVAQTTWFCREHRAIGERQLLAN